MRFSMFEYAYDHSGPDWSHRPVAKRPLHPLRASAGARGRQVEELAERLQGQAIRHVHLRAASAASSEASSASSSPEQGDTTHMYMYMYMYVYIYIYIYISCI